MVGQNGLSDPGGGRRKRCRWLHRQGLTLPQCVGAEAAIELNENMRNQVITCTDVLATDVIRVYRVPASNIPALLLECNAENQCSNSAGYTAMRSSNVVNVTFINPALRTVFGNSSIVFEALLGSNISERCHLDVVYKPNTALCNAQFVTTGSEWLAVGKCVIDKVFSFRDRYSCVWNESNGMLTTAVLNNQTALNITPISGTSRDDSYYTMGCGFSKPLPEMSGNYNYTVIVYPGDVHLKVNFTGSNLIELPAVPTPGCPNGYIIENTNLNCTCFTTNLGTPPGKVAWSGSNDSFLAFNVKRSHNNNNFTCDVRWGSRVMKQNVTTLLVAYGPDSVVINGPPDPFDTNGEQNLTLHCTALDYNPQVSYLLRRVNSPSVICSSSSCTLRPQPLQDDGVVYECLANNSATSLLSAKVNYTLNTNYPPTFPPSIVNYSDNDIVYSGDFLNMTCIVKGGLPSNATKVNFNCSGKPDGNDIIGNDEVNSTITFTQLNDNDHGRVCTCTAKWKNYTWYTLSAQRIMNVYYPPQHPNITETNKQMIPYLEGEYVRLSCDLTFKGNPPANVSWSFYRAANKSRTNDTSVQLELQSLGKNDNNKTVTCSAENNFTQTKGSAVMSAFVLQVYYRPILELRQGEDNSCIFTSELWQCAVTEGRRIDIHCMADSNPVSGNITWHNANWTSVTFTSTSQLYIPSANKSEHNGIFTCRAITTKPNISDTRLPLNSTKDLYVLVKYKVEQISMSLNFAFGDVAINEHEHLTIWCQASGRPTPMLLLYKGNTSSQLLHRIPGGILNINDERSVLSYSINSLHCENSSVYTCIARNEVENSSITATRQLYVNCAPRIIPNSPMPKEITFYGDPVPVIFEVIAYPKITEAYIKAIDSASNMISSDVNMKFPLMCDESSLLYTSLCILVIKNATSADVGTYQMTFINGIGELTINIQIFVNIIDHCARCQEIRDEGLSPGAGAGITLAVEAVVAALVMVILWRKGFIFSCRDKHADRSIKINSETDDWSTMKNDMQVESCLDLPTMSSEARTNSQYEGLRVGEIGLASAYESIKQETKCRAETGEKLSSYETLQTRDIGAVSPYDSIQQAQNVNVLHSTGHVYANR